MLTADEYREMAAECESNAEAAIESGIRTKWLDLARQWRELAVKAQELKNGADAA